MSLDFVFFSFFNRKQTDVGKLWRNRLLLSAVLHLHINCVSRSFSAFRMSVIFSLCSSSSSLFSPPSRVVGISYSYFSLLSHPISIIIFLFPPRALISSPFSSTHFFCLFRTFSTFNSPICPNYLGLFSRLYSLRLNFLLYIHF